MAKAQLLDFTNVKDGGGSFNKRHKPAGDYKARITKFEMTTKKDDKSKKMWLFTIDVDGGTYPLYCTFDENQLWKIRNLFMAAGINIPKKRVSVDPNKVVGKTIGVTLEDDEYDGKTNSVVQATFPVSELDATAASDDDDEDYDEDGDPDEEAPKAKKTKKGKKKKVKDEDLEALDLDDV